MVGAALRAARDGRLREAPLPSDGRMWLMSDDDCCPGGDCSPKVNRRDFARLVGFGLTSAAAPSVAAGSTSESTDQVAAAVRERAAETARLTGDLAWPSLRV